MSCVDIFLREKKVNVEKCNKPRRPSAIEFFFFCFLCIFIFIYFNGGVVNINIKNRLRFYIYFLLLCLESCLHHSDIRFINKINFLKKRTAFNGTRYLPKISNSMTLSRDVKL